MLHAVVLGAAAGGGFPQWNSNAPACREVRRGGSRARARSQASVALSANERDWFVLNASPDLRLQIEATAVLHPREGLRSSPISGVVATGGDVDAIAGLLHLRERHHFTLFAPARVLDVIAANPIFGVLAPDYVGRVELPLDETVALAGMAGNAGLAVRAFAVPGKVPLYLEEGGRDPGLSEAGDAVGLELIDTTAGNSFFFIPGCAFVTAGLRQRLAGSALVFFDGTLWRDDEMIRAGVGDKTGRRMGHISMSGPEGAIAAFADLAVRRRIFIHINNSNPVLFEDSPERREAETAGWEIAYDGMEVRL
jgi:pyrroloquinoline quinone biosynthesis protein B